MEPEGRRRRGEAGPPPPEQKDRVLTVPNALSAMRLVLVPVFLWLLLVEHAEEQNDRGLQFWRQLRLHGRIAHFQHGASALTL